MIPEMHHNEHTGSLAWTCPSNIALIKYWGKRAGQIPMNPSLSMTLQESGTHTEIDYSYVPGREGMKLHFRFEGRESPVFEQRIRKYLDGLEALLPHLSHTHLEIRSENSFPHSSGIASSASSMGALALCLVQMEEEISGSMDPDRFWQKASRLARLGSGSAARSIYPQFALWGAGGPWDHSSDEFAIPVKEFHKDFQKVRDAILVVDSGPKKISSSVGHALMENNPYANERFQQARDNLDILYTAMIEGNWQSFIVLMEEEALSLHAMMMTSRPGYLLLQPGTLSILQLIREFRKETGHKLGFTLDAGANVHLLYADADAERVEAFIRSELLSYCENGKVIWDRMGMGPEKSER